MRFEVLGPLRLHNGRGVVALRGEPQRRILAVLLSRAGAPLSSAELVDALWPYDPPDNAVKNVQSYLSRLKSTLDRPNRITRGPAGYGIALNPGELDSQEFTDRIQRARAARSTGEPDLAADLLGQALRLWRGRPYADLDDCVALAPEIQRLTQTHLKAVEDHVDLSIGLGRHADVVPVLSALLAEHPDREPPARLLMLALHRSGRQTDALQVYTRIRNALVDEHGVEPGRELRDLHQFILSGGESGRATPSPTPSPPSPDPGRRAPPVPAQLPADIGVFAGREAELAELDALLAAEGERPGAVVISALLGTAGVGKTALAVHWAHRIADRFPDGQLYVNLRGFHPSSQVMSPADAVRGFLDALGVPQQRLPVDLDAQAALYRSLLAGKQVLVVLDNARDTEQVRPLLPGGPGCLVVVTSRNQLTGLLTAHGARPVALDLLTRTEARQLLTRRLGVAPGTTERGPADEIIDSCARLPLALAVVAARAAARPQFRLATLAAELHDPQSGLDAFAGSEVSTDVRAVFSWSYRHLTSDAARLLRLLGVHAGPDITAPATASLAGVPPRQARRDLAELTSAHLLNEHMPGRYTFHDLLRAYARELAHTEDDEADRRTALLRMLAHYLHTAYAADRLLFTARDPINLARRRPGVVPEDLAGYGEAIGWFTAEHDVLLAAVDRAVRSGLDTHAWQLCWALGNFLNVRGHWHDLAASARTALEAARRLGDRTGESLAYHGLALADLKRGRFEDAHASLREALDLAAELGDHHARGAAHGLRSWVYRLQGRDADALDQAQQALDLFRASGFRYGAARALDQVGRCHAQLGAYQEALTCCQKALEILQELGDPVGQASTWDSLGYAHHHLGHHQQAITCYRHAIQLLRDTRDSYYEADTLARLGDTQHAAGDTAAARSTWEEALATFEGLHHPEADHVRTRLRRLDQPDPRAVPMPTKPASGP